MDSDTTVHAWGGARAREPLAQWLPDDLARRLADEPQKAVPAFAKNPGTMARLSRAVEFVPTSHRLVLGDARTLPAEDGTVHLVLTS